MSGAPAGEIAIGLLGDVMLGRGVGTELARNADPAELWDPELRALTASLDAAAGRLRIASWAR